MDRRSFLAFAAGGAALGSARAARRERRAGRNGLRLSITWGMLGRMPVREALALLERHGFDAYEMFDWRDPALLASFVAERKNHELACATLVANRGVTAPGCGLVNPRERESFLEQVGLAIEAAKQVECKRLVVLTGNELGGMPRSEQMSNAVGALRAAAPLVERSGMTAVVEVLNTYVNHAGYFLYYVRDAAELIDRVASSSVKILFDIYHVQIMEGNLIENIRANVDRIGHFHIGDVPGRNEPGTGEINYRNVFRAIYDLGDRFAGYAALEYRPKVPLEENLAAMRKMTTFA
ncbi:MAG: hydroxypyruvate isomerase [Acidobacteria bacterium]|nr:MAG: hydroxypyruvate isomerase [Acidobacteriota bacterium]